MKVINNNRNSINICCSVNHSYVKYLYVMLLSLFESNAGERFNIFLLQNDLSTNDKDSIRDLVESKNSAVYYTIIDKSRLASILDQGIGPYTPEALFRLLMLDVLPRDMERVLYLDVDILINGSIRELYNSDFDSNLFVACEDLYTHLDDYRKRLFHRDEGRYFNSGVMLCNVKLMQQEVTVDALIDTALELEGELLCADQEVLNYLFYNRVKWIDPYQYNYLIYLDNEGKSNYRDHNPVILHFAGCNPWKRGKRSEVYTEWWNYADKSPYRDEIYYDYRLNLDNAVNEQEHKIDELNNNIIHLWSEVNSQWTMSGIYRSLYNMLIGGLTLKVDKPVVIYGAGRFGHLLLEEFERAGLKSKIVAFVDESRTGQVKGVPVWNSIDRFDDEKYCIIVTPARGNEQIVNEIKSSMRMCEDVISLKDFLEDFILYSEMESPEWRVESSNSSLYAKKEDFDAWCDWQPIVNNRVACINFPDFADHNKYIALALKKRCPDADIVVFTDEDYSDQWEGIHFVYKGNWRKVEYMKRTAKVCLFNSDIALQSKRDGQVFIETKHWSSVTLKKFFLDAETFDTDHDFYNRMVNGFKMLDYIITGSDFDTQTCRSGFAFSGEVWQVGSPRSDVLFQRDKFRAEIRKRYGLTSDTKIMIYAPTYRFVKGDEHHAHEAREIALDYNALWQALTKRFGGEWVIMLRLHPTVAVESASISLPEFVVDASDYMDSGELIAACDGMISDYSSIMFEPSFIGLPVFLFATDREAYVGEYEFLIDYDTLPYPIAESNEELVANIETFDEAAYTEKVNKFLRQYGVHEDGHASERAAELIAKIL